MIENDAEDRLLARSIFGTDDRKTVESMILDWTGQQGFTPKAVCRVELSIGAVVTVDLCDRTRLCVKVWPTASNPRALSAQVAVQRAMAERRFPAPAVLSEVSPLGPGWAVVMAYNRAGFPTDARVPGVRTKMAGGLADFIVMAAAYRELECLPSRQLPPEGAIWPNPHNALFDFEATAQGAEWIDAIASKALETMRSATSLIVVGHLDWSAKNMRMNESGIAVLYDWDAVFLDREAFVLGAAAAHFPVTWELDVPGTPSVSEVVAFIRDYEHARGTPLTLSELAETAAGATYARAYTARCEHALDPDGDGWCGSSRESLQTNGAFNFDPSIDIHRSCAKG
jgi:hypothetical protein